jgi:hypothetical protein
MKSIGNLLLRNFYMKIIKVVNFYIQCEIQNLVCSACVVLFYICDRQYYFCSQYFNIAKNCFQNSKNHHLIPSAKFFIGNFFANERKHP